MQKLHVVLASVALCLAACGSGDNGPEIPSFDITEPQALALPPALTAASAGQAHMCALDATGQAWCWGSDEDGRLGAAASQRCMSGTIPCSPVPLRAAGALRFGALAASARGSCALAADGAAWCWGMGEGGQLGDGLRTSSTAAVAAAGGHRFTALYASNATGLVCGLKADRSLWCWGPGFGFGMQGPAASVVPQRWDAASGRVAWSRLAIGQGHACGLDDAGGLWCMGSAAFALLGDGSAVASATPVAVGAGRRYIDVAVGLMHGCALAADGQAWCWGLGAAVGIEAAVGQLQATPVAVGGSTRFVSLAAAGARSCGLTADGSAWCWGEGYSGLLGNGASERHVSPVAVMGGHHFRSLALGLMASCGLDNSGSAWCWGNNEAGAVGAP